MTTPRTDWEETYLGGSEFAEAELVRTFMEDIHVIQAENKAKGRSPSFARAFHAKIHAGIENARFEVLPTIPDFLQVGYFQPNKSYNALVRFSNASGTVQPDKKPDLRGVAVRVVVDSRTAHDFLMTNAAASHARDARQFMAFAKAAAGSKLTLLPKLIFSVGLAETIRMLSTVIRQTSRHVSSLATEQFWSRAPYKFGPYAIKFTLVPTEQPKGPSGQDDNYLREDLTERLRKGPVVFDFKIQTWVGNKETPIEDGTVEWLEKDSPLIPVARLTIPCQDIATAQAEAVTNRVNELAFNPWDTTEEFRPLGSLNRARRLVYKSSAGLRAGHESYEREGIATKLLYAIIVPGFKVINKFIPWHKLPPYIGALNLIAYRRVLRAKNLYDTNDPHAVLNPSESKVDIAYIRARSPDGKFNDLNYPDMGAACARFGRNVPRQYTYPNLDLLDTPSPREISRHLLQRNEFKPATSLNLLAAAWIQFQVHDWLSHLDPEKSNPGLIPLKPDDDWGSNEMQVRRTPRAAQSEGEKQDNAPPVYQNEESHWWDGSQIYGDDKETEKKLRTGEGGHLKLDPNYHLLLIDPDTKLPITGFTNNWWIGLFLFHTVFAQEHNAICDRLHLENPYWDDEEIFNTARLINTALMAKIHTVEWTPAILAHPTIKIALDANWWGLATEQVHRLLGRISDNEAISGIPGSPVDHQCIPFSLTEEFVAVYRLHPLIPDEIQISDVRTGEPLKKYQIAEMAFTKAQDVFEQGVAKMPDVLYSFGISNPGAITLHNYPNFLRKLEIPVATDPKQIDRTIDLATTDIYRDRERGVPRYNKFRELFHCPPVSSFDELTGNDHKLAAEIRTVYGTDANGKDRVDLLDLMVGMFAEPLPKGFGFSDTAFRVFILMASRRLKSDRYFTTDFTPEIYTQVGLDWISNNGFSSILIRHYPELAPALRNLNNPFAPWNNVNEV